MDRCCSAKTSMVTVLTHESEKNARRVYVEFKRFPSWHLSTAVHQHVENSVRRRRNYMTVSRMMPTLELSQCGVTGIINVSVMTGRSTPGKHVEIQVATVTVAMAADGSSVSRAMRFTRLARHRQSPLQSAQSSSAQKSS